METLGVAQRKPWFETLGLFFPPLHCCKPQTSLDVSNLRKNEHARSRQAPPRPLVHPLRSLGRHELLLPLHQERVLHHVVVHRRVVLAAAGFLCELQRVALPIGIVLVVVLAVV